MITAVDTNVILDILAADQKFGVASLKMIKNCQQEGILVICEIVLAELSRYFEQLKNLTDTLDDLDIKVESLGEEACFLAGQAFLTYRMRSGKRDRILPDFLIGAHAQLRCSRLLTRDRGFYRDYFAHLLVVDPSQL
jgi:predicted nucleic acid-binding protein